MFKVKAIIIFSAPEFAPPVEVEQLPRFEKKWTKGDLYSTRGPRARLDGGFQLRLLDPVEDWDWPDTIEKALEEIISELGRFDLPIILLEPELSVYLETDGDDVPQIHFRREFLEKLSTFSCRIDVDVVFRLSWRTQEISDQ